MFLAISFEIIGVLDSYFIHKYIILKYRSISIRIISTDFCWSHDPSSLLEKWLLGDIFWIHCFIGIIFHTQVYNHRTQVKFD